MKLFSLFFRARTRGIRDHHPQRASPADPTFWILHAR